MKIRLLNLLLILFLILDFNSIVSANSNGSSLGNESQSYVIGSRDVGQKSVSAGFNIFIPNVSASDNTNGWWTVAGNAQRTSWSPEEVTGSLHLEWYRPIDAYISQNTQIIASNGLLYVSTSRGLYALDAVTGALAWRFDTELPLGNSPTVSNGVVYVGGFDHKIHALNANNGVHYWSFDGASAGYSSNPLVMGGIVYAGNRDGYMYAIGAHGTAKQGKLIWRYKTGGPIILSAAAKSGIIYFTSSDNYAYALRMNTQNINGELVWKSQKLPGDGYQSYWPVITTDPNTSRDLVVFSASSGYRLDPYFGSRSVKNCSGNTTCADDTVMHFNDALYDITDPNATVGRPVQLSQSWAQGKSIYDYSRLTEYLENNPNANAHLHKPWRRSYVILNMNDGSEYTFDSDKDGYGEYAPVIPFATKNGEFYPPVIGDDGLLYFNNAFYANRQGRVMGWRIGTQYFALSEIQGAIDEPQAITAGGSTIYRNLCCDRVGNYTDMADPGPNYYSPLWSYSSTLSQQAPNYDQKWWFIDSGLERLYGNYGGVNGVYNNHGDQNPIIPYNGKLYAHRSNAIFSYGKGTVRGMLPKIDPVSIKDQVAVPSLADLNTRLEEEITKILQAGHLRPGYYNNGQFGEEYYIFSDYFNNPGETLLTLSKAYPHISPNLQAQLLTYLQNEFQTYFDPVMYSKIGWKDGASRDALSLPPEVDADRINYPKTTDAGYGWGWSWHYPQYNFYAMWKYAQLVPSNALKIYNLAKGKLEAPVSSLATNSFLTSNPWELNGYVAGYIGFLKLQELANMTTADSQLRTQVSSELTRLQNLRVSNFSKDTPYLSLNPNYIRRTNTISRNFLMLVPEFGDYLNQRILSKVQTAINEYNYVAPYWMATRYNGVIGESARQNLYDVPAMFQARAYILKESRNTLIKYLDAPAFPRGDLYFIQNLIASLEAP